MSPTRWVAPLVWPLTWQSRQATPRLGFSVLRSSVLLNCCWGNCVNRSRSPSSCSGFIIPLKSSKKLSSVTSLPWETSPRSGRVVRKIAGSRRRHETRSTGEILDHHFVGGLACRRVVYPQDRRRVKRPHQLWSPRGLKYPAAVLQHAELRAHQGLQRRGAQTDNEVGTDGAELGFKPGPARFDFRRSRSAMDATLASGFPLEVLYNVGNVDLASSDAGLCQRAVQHLPRRPDERGALEVLLISGLLSAQHEPGVCRPFSAHDMRRILVTLASP